MIPAPTRCIIIQRGNGWPAVGAYVTGDGRLYRVAEIESTIHTGDSRGDYVYAAVREATLEDCDDGDVHSALVVVTNADRGTPPADNIDTARNWSANNSHEVVDTNSEESYDTPALWEMYRSARLTRIGKTAREACEAAGYQELIELADPVDPATNGIVATDGRKLVVLDWEGWEAVVVES